MHSTDLVVVMLRGKCTLSASTRIKGSKECGLQRFRTRCLQHLPLGIYLLAKLGIGSCLLKDLTVTMQNKRQDTKEHY
jgi:hypothetical protein